MSPTRFVSLILVLIAASQLGATRSTIDISPAPPHPDHPETYFQLGELLGAQAQTSAQQDRAEQVLAMGATLAMQQGEHQLAASCCIALVELASDPQHQRDLWDLALLIDPDRFPSWVKFRSSPADSSARRSAAECLRLIRNAKHADAAELFRTQSVKDQLAAAAESLGLSPSTTLDQIRLLLSHQRDDACRGRVFDTRVRDGESSRFLCPDHQYPIGSAPDAKSLELLLSLETACLESAAQINGWGGVVAMGLDQPARTPSIEMLAQQYDIDPARPYWDGQGWSSNP